MEAQPYNYVTAHHASQRIWYILALISIQKTPLPIGEIERRTIETLQVYRGGIVQPTYK
jgi:hypothetical protein